MEIAQEKSSALLVIPRVLAIGVLDIEEESQRFTHLINHLLNVFSHPRSPHRNSLLDAIDWHFLMRSCNDLHQHNTGLFLVWISFSRNVFKESDGPVWRNDAGHLPKLKTTIWYLQWSVPEISSQLCRRPLKTIIRSAFICFQLVSKPYVIARFANENRPLIWWSIWYFPMLPIDDLNGGIWKLMHRNMLQLQKNKYTTGTPKHYRIRSWLGIST